MGRQRLKKGLTYVVWVLTASLLVAAVFTWFDPEPTLGGFWHSFVYSVVYAGSISQVAEVVFRLAAPFFLHWPGAARVAAVMGTLLVATAIGCLIAGLVFTVIGFHSLDQYWTVYREGFRISVVVAMILGGGTILHEQMTQRLEETTLKLRTKELERQRALNAATEARLASLESSIHPHFLFNALNSISSLIPDDPKRAERLVGRMSALLRFSLDSRSSGLVALDQEMKIVRDFLEIETVRFGERLRYEIELAGSFDGVKVPPLSIQTLVENSVKHAVAPRLEGAHIKVVCVVRDGDLIVEVSDDGDGFEPDSIPAGRGLDNLGSRLSALSEQETPLRIGRDDSRTVVSFTVPQQVATP